MDQHTTVVPCFDCWHEATLCSDVAFDLSNLIFHATWRFATRLMTFTICNQAPGFHQLTEPTVVLESTHTPPGINQFISSQVVGSAEGRRRIMKMFFLVFLLREQEIPRFFGLFWRFRVLGMCLYIYEYMLHLYTYLATRVMTPSQRTSCSVAWHAAP